MARRLSQRTSLNRISEEQLNGPKGAKQDEEGTTTANEDDSDKQTKSRRSSQFTHGGSRKHRLTGGTFTMAHNDNPMNQVSNSVTFSMSYRGSTDTHDQDHEMALRARSKATFQLKPKTLFNVYDVKGMIKEVFENAFQDSSTLTMPTNLLCKNLTEAIKVKVRKLNYDRYRLIVTVFIGTKDNLALKVTSRCVWDERWDNYADYTYKGKDFYYLGVVYGIYKE